MPIRHQLPMFLFYAKELYESMQKLNIDWCKTILYKGQYFGGWITKNYLAHGQLFMLVYQDVLLLEEKEDFVEPNKPRIDKSWNAKELKDKVKQLYEIVDGQPPIIDTTTKIEEKITLIHTWHFVLVRLMNPEVTNNDIYVMQT